MKKLGFDLILLGDPTSGKDTQAVLLMKRYSLKAVESGKHWRTIAKKKNAEGAWLRKTMSLGHPAPVVLMKKFLRDSVRNAPKNKNLIFIGNPKLKPEGQFLTKLLKEKNRDFFVLYLKILVPEILKRTKLRARLKSEDEGVRNRIRYTKRQMSKTVKYFQSLDKLKLINGNQSIPKVTKDILKEIEKHKKLRI
ncbi:MAG: nucleoside monophosphate kinase [Patescibacteria group bacterium]